MTKGVEEEGEMVMGCGMRGEEGMGEGGGGEEEEKKGRRAGGMRDEGEESGWGGERRGRGRSKIYFIICH